MTATLAWAAFGPDGTMQLRSLSDDERAAWDAIVSRYYT